MSREVRSSEEMRLYLRRLGYASEGQQERLAGLEEDLLNAAGGAYPFLIHQVRDGVLPLDAPIGTKPAYMPWLSWFLVTGARGHQQVNCEDVLLSARRKQALR